MLAAGASQGDAPVAVTAGAIRRRLQLHYFYVSTE